MQNDMTNPTTVQVLVATVQQSGHDLVPKMRLATPAVIANQTDHNGSETITVNQHPITYIHTDQRGVGKNRNVALQAANAQYCLLADDDMFYHDGYAHTVAAAFAKYPNAAVVFFNLQEPETKRHIITRPGPVHWWNVLRYGAARAAINLPLIRQAGITFNEHFGGGTEHSHGEDSIFFMQCLQRGLKLYAVPNYIATLTEERPSTWQGNYDHKYIQDQGALYRAMSPRHWRFFIFQDVCRRARKTYQMTPQKAYKIMLYGAKKYAQEFLKAQSD